MHISFARRIRSRQRYHTTASDSATSNVRMMIIVGVQRLHLNAGFLCCLSCPLLISDRRNGTAVSRHRFRLNVTWAECHMGASCPLFRNACCIEYHFCAFERHRSFGSVSRVLYRFPRRLQRRFVQLHANRCFVSMLFQ